MTISNRPYCILMGLFYVFISAIKKKNQGSRGATIHLIAYHKIYFNQIAFNSDNCQAQQSIGRMTGLKSKFRIRKCNCMIRISIFSFSQLCLVPLKFKLVVYYFYSLGNEGFMQSGHTIKCYCRGFGVFASGSCLKLN